MENTFVWNGSLAKNIGKHTLKTGFNAEHWATSRKGKNANYFAGSMVFTSDKNNPLDTGYAYSNALLGVLFYPNHQPVSLIRIRHDGRVVSAGFLEGHPQSHRRLGFALGLGPALHDHQDKESGFVPATWNPNQVLKLIQPTLVNGVRMGKDPYTGATLPAVTIGAIAPEAPNQLNGIVNRLTDPSYPQACAPTAASRPRRASVLPGTLWQGQDRHSRRRRRLLRSA